MILGQRADGHRMNTATRIDGERRSEDPLVFPAEIAKPLPTPGIAKVLHRITPDPAKNLR
jgi:hypothetical protein